MIIKDNIRESSIAQGDLVFIYHKTKPSKTGWWRKIREGSTDNKTIYYILEKPMHKDFDIKYEIETTHTENGFCVMTDKTLKEGEHYKYEILADIRGSHNILLSSNGYKLNDNMFLQKSIIPEDKDNVIVTNKFIELIKLYKPQKKKISEIENLVENLL
jgi:hypothetical protein